MRIPRAIIDVQHSALSLTVFDDLLLNPFASLDEKSFPRFAAAVLRAHLRLLATKGDTSVSLARLFRGHARGTADTLAKTVPVRADVEIVSLSKFKDGKARGESGQQEHPDVGAGTTKEDRKALPAEGDRVIDVTTGSFIAFTYKTSPSADALGPWPLDLQFKWTENLTLDHADMPSPRSLPTKRDDPFYLFPSLIREELAKIPDDAVLGFFTARALVCPRSYVLPERVVLLDGRRLLRWLGPFASSVTFRRDPALDGEEQRRLDEDEEGAQVELSPKYKEWMEHDALTPEQKAEKKRLKAEQRMRDER